jgi:hypothetical protein
MSMFQAIANRAVATIGAIPAARLRALLTDGEYTAGDDEKPTKPRL